DHPQEDEDHDSEQAEQDLEQEVLRLAHLADELQGRGAGGEVDRDREEARARAQRGPRAQGRAHRVAQRQRLDEDAPLRPQRRLAPRLGVVAQALVQGHVDLVGVADGPAQRAAGQAPGPRHRFHLAAGPGRRPRQVEVHVGVDGRAHHVRDARLAVAVRPDGAPHPPHLQRTQRIEWPLARGPPVADHDVLAALDVDVEHVLRAEEAQAQVEEAAEERQVHEPGHPDPSGLEHGAREPDDQYRGDGDEDRAHEEPGTVDVGADALDGHGGADSNRVRRGSLWDSRVPESHNPADSTASVRLSLERLRGITAMARDLNSRRRMDTLLKDLRYALRSLRGKPGFTAIAVATLALGIGGSTAIFSLTSAVLLAQPPLREPDRLVTIWENASKIGFPRNDLSPATFAALRDRAQSFEGL